MSRKGACRSLSQRRFQAEAVLGPVATLLRLFRRDRWGSISTLTAVTGPPLLMTAGVGVEVTNWTLVHQQLQRTADIAALAGAADFAVTGDASHAANAGASIAELNGSTGATTRTWDPGNQTLMDNLVTVQLGHGARDSSHIGVAVTVAQVVPLQFTRLLTSAPSITVDATAWAEVAVPDQPCLVALGAGSGITNGPGSSGVILSGCSARSNTAIATGSAGTMSALSYYANGAIAGGGSGAQHPNDGTIPDPYAQFAPVRNAFAQLSPGAGHTASVAQGVKYTIPPGTYAQWSIQGAATLAPGTYYLNGDITLGAQASLSGSNVTIVSSGGLSMAAGATLTLSAAKTGGTSGAIPGIVLAGTTTHAMSFGGSGSPALTGVVYEPNADLTFAGSAQNGQTGCLEVIARSVTLHNAVRLAANCSAYGALPFASDNTAPATLVQ